VWLIARHAALESLRDRMTLVMSALFSVVLPLGLVVAVIRPLGALEDPSPLGALLALYLLLVGLMPASAPDGVAAGLFAGEKERGGLTPLLAAPASNTSIFSGKVLGAILPSFLYSALADFVFLAAAAYFLGPARLTALPVGTALAAVALVPCVACLTAAVASLISSRVRTYNTAQQVTGLALLPMWGLVFSLTARLQEVGPGGLLLAAVGLAVLDLCLILLSARTWRREEVLAQR
jgi:ABC-type Na+ efflux pump permease subunit